MTLRCSCQQKRKENNTFCLNCEGLNVACAIFFLPLVDSYLTENLITYYMKWSQLSYGLWWTTFVDFFSWFIWLQVGQIFQKFECRDQLRSGVIRNVVRWSIPSLLEVQNAFYPGICLFGICQLRINTLVFYLLKKYHFC